jgi:hypothetical protein
MISQKLVYCLFCHSRESGNPVILNCSGLLLEFIPMEIGAGVTSFQLFTKPLSFQFHKNVFKGSWVCGETFTPVCLPARSRLRLPTNLFGKQDGTSLKAQGVLSTCCSFKPFVLSLSKHERLSDAPFDRLRANGASLTEQY